MSDLAESILAATCTELAQRELERRRVVLLTADAQLVRAHERAARALRSFQVWTKILDEAVRNEAAVRERWVEYDVQGEETCPAL